MVCDPYKNSRDWRPLHEICFFTGCHKYIDVVEPYHPKMVLIQLCKDQIIPPAPLASKKLEEGPLGASTMYPTNGLIIYGIGDGTMY